MEILLGMALGAIYGRNAQTINRQVYGDVCRVVAVLSKTSLAINGYYMLEGLYATFERRFVQPKLYLHDLFCDCRRCRPLSIRTYVRRVKGVKP